jgi:hypothetical protein
MLLQANVVCNEILEESIGQAERFYPATEDPPVSAKGLYGALSSSAGASAVLQRTLPEGRPQMVALEGTAAIPGDKIR